MKPYVLMFSPKLLMPLNTRTTMELTFIFYSCKHATDLTLSILCPCSSMTVPVCLATVDVEVLSSLTSFVMGYRDHNILILGSGTLGHRGQPISLTTRKGGKFYRYCVMYYRIVV